MKTKIIHALPINKPQTPTAKSPVTNPPTLKIKSVQTVLKPTTPVKEKPVQAKVVKSKSVDTPSSHQKQENIRDNVKKTLFEQLTNRLKMVDDIKLTDDEVRAFKFA